MSPAQYQSINQPITSFGDGRHEGLPPLKGPSSSWAPDDSLLPLHAAKLCPANYELIREEEISELRAVARLYRRKETGTEILHIYNSDKYRRVAFGFTTCASNSRGEPHAYEHLVGCESIDFFLPDPWTAYANQSLGDMNAETGPDNTVYYAASPHLQDLGNACRILLSGLCRNAFTDSSFAKEVWRLEPTPDGTGHRLNGVILNEEKGYFANPMDRLGMLVQQRLLPDTRYRHDYIGDPAEIPDITPNSLRDFGEKFYRPSNLKVVLYGNWDPNAPLTEVNNTPLSFFDLLDIYLGQDDRPAVEVEFPVQAPFKEPQFEVHYYPGGEMEDAARDTIVSVNWSLGPWCSRISQEKLVALNLILLGYSDSPVRQALIESGFGEDVDEDGTGVASDTIYDIFSVVMIGTAISRAEEVQNTILAALHKTIKDGIDPGLLERALGQMEYNIRSDAISEDAGESAVTSAFASWASGLDPIANQRYEQELALIRKQVDTGERVFENIIQELLLDNPHRLTLVLRPKRSLISDLQEQEQKRVTQMLAKADDEGSNAAAEIRYTSPEVLPRIGIPSLKRTADHIELATLEDGFFVHSCDGHGLVAIDIGVDVSGLRPDLVPFLGTLVNGIFDLNDPNEKHFLGEVEPSLHLHNVGEQREQKLRLFFHARCPEKTGSELLAYLDDILRRTNLDRKSDVINLLLSQKASIEGRLHEEGSEFAFDRAAAQLDIGHRYLELYGGIERLLCLRNVIPEARRAWGRVAERLEETRQFLLDAAAPVVCLAGGESAIKKLVPELQAFRARFTDKQQHKSIQPADSFANGHEGFTVPAAVNYIGQAFDLAAVGYPLRSGATDVLTQMLLYGYLWEQVRREGGAYGPEVEYCDDTGILTMGSYLDRNIYETIKIFEGVPEWLEGQAKVVKELRRSKVGAIGVLDTPDSIFENAFGEFTNRLCGLPRDYWQISRNEIFATSGEECRRFAEAVRAAAERVCPIVVLGARDALEEAKRAAASDSRRAGSNGEFDPERWMSITSLE